MKQGSDRAYLIAFKHRVESERDFFMRTPRDHVVALSYEDNRILVTQLDRNGICSLPCDEHIISKALQVLDIVASLKESNGIQHTVFIVFDHREALVADVAWNEGDKVVMTVVSDEIIVLDERL